MRAQEASTEGAVYVRYWEVGVASALSWHTCGKVTGTMKGLALRALGKLRGLRPLLHTGGDVQGYMHRVEQFDRTSQSHKCTQSQKKVLVPAPFLYMFYRI